MYQLNEGDEIRIHGFVMLQGLRGGYRYRIYEISKRPGINYSGYAYHIARVLKSGKLSKRDRIAHYVEDVDLWLDVENRARDLNRIEIVKRGGS